MDFTQLFKNLGLEDREPEVYLALIKLATAQPASVVAQHTGLNRTTVYKTLVKLVRTGLVTKTMRGGITCFYAENPEGRLEDKIIKQKKSLDKVHNELIEGLAEIKQMKKYDLVFPKMKYYEGAEGVKRVYEDTLVEGKPICAFENAEFMTPEINDYIFNDYVPRRAENEIFVQVITPENELHKKARRQDKKCLRETRFSAAMPFPLEIEINIYGHKTAFFSYKANEMFAAILESQSIAGSMRAIFDLCWHHAY